MALLLNGAFARFAEISALLLTIPKVNRLHLDEKTMYFLRYLSDIDLDVLKSVNLSEKTSIKIKRALDLIYDDQVGLYVPARKFLNEMTSFDFAFEKGLDKTE